MINFRKKRGRINIIKEIAPDEIFMDAQNLPGFDTDQFEGRIEKPISKSTFVVVGVFFLLIGIVFLGRVWNLQIQRGEAFALQSEKNRLRQSVIFADRGIIRDIHNKPLVWNNAPAVDGDFSTREYISTPGFSNLLGYVTYPKKDSAGFYFEEETVGVAGIEKIYDELLSGENGSKIIETDALNAIVEEQTIKKPQHGNDLILTIDSEVQEHFRNAIAKVITEQDFQGGGGIIMDVVTGEVLSLVSFPEFDSNVLSDGTDSEKIASFVNNPQNPFLNRVVDGLYTPGSIVKPFIAVSALSENVISPSRQILSTGKLIIPNPYNPENPSIFTDWKAHGLVDMRTAIAVSSNIYFYQIGGGFEDQKGLGITNINKYLHMFGFGESVDSPEFRQVPGVVPNPEWKMENFDDDWRLGDTYFTSIGQYGFLATPLQIVTAISAIANDGILLEPRLVFDEKISTKMRRQIPIDPNDFRVVKEGMRKGVMEGTAKGLSYPDFEIAAKTGTAELGETKERVNSWVTGFFPYENPRFAFAIVLERGSRKNLIGGVAAARHFFDWLKVNKPEYIK